MGNFIVLTGGEVCYLFQPDMVHSHKAVEEMALAIKTIWKTSARHVLLPLVMGLAMFMPIRQVRAVVKRAIHSSSRKLYVQLPGEAADGQNYH